MIVEATQRGYYMCIRNPGDIFEIPENLYSKSWMVLVEPNLTVEEQRDAGPPLLRRSP